MRAVLIKLSNGRSLKIIRIEKNYHLICLRSGDRSLRE